MSEWNLLLRFFFGAKEKFDEDDAGFSYSGLVRVSEEFFEEDRRSREENCRY